MKNLGRGLASLCLALLLTASVAIAEGWEVLDASLTTSAVYVNDQRAAITGYSIEGSTYFRLRDLAAALAGTASEFDVVWNEEERLVELDTGVSYGGAVWEGRLPEAAAAVPSEAGLLLDGQSVELAAFNIMGSTYYRLRDLGKVLGFDVYWIQMEDCICIYTGLGGNAELAESSGGDLRLMNREKSTQRWAAPCRSYIFDEGATFSVLDVSESDEGDLLLLDVYASESWALLDTWEIPMELDFFGGFYAGEMYNYVVFGCNNMEEDDAKEVIRVVQYSKDFRRVGEASVLGGQCAIIRPFDAGTLRMSEYGDELVIHTSRALYARSSPAADPESQYTLVLDAQTMEILNDPGLYQGCNVSRSFNQFVVHDGEQHVLLDHGDANPRGIVLHKYDGSSYEAKTLLEIPGEPGASCTGVTVGGFEVSESSYLVAINSVDHSLVEGYTDYTLEGLTLDERNVVLLVEDKFGRYGETEQILLADYVGSGALGSTPYLVPLPEDRYLVLWEEFSYYESDFGITSAWDNGVRYVEVDGAGWPLTDVQALPDARLSYDCQPVYMDGGVMWYVNARAGRIFYRVPC